MLPSSLSEVLFGESCSRTAFSGNRSQCLAGSTSGVFCSSPPSPTHVRGFSGREVSLTEIWRGAEEGAEGFPFGWGLLRKQPKPAHA